MDDRSASRWLIVARTLQRLLRRRGNPPDAARVVALARETLDRLLMASCSIRGLVEEVYGVDGQALGITTEEVVFEFAHEAFTNLREAVAASICEQALLETYRVPMNKLVSVVFSTLREYWSQKGIELDQRAIEVLRQDGSLRAWWSAYWSQEGWHS
ncbi:hypothetical protein GQ464_007545 [Rhodocaloribacter litoris]|uniref:hypothetical protein n=1 Tax=Rhodocaloribacter litoris TaxID=2558931 RepID=UPI0014246BA6|nr:hypothetical protein [Rhodocaloribacter litoris]QXD16781.1 hypothetical protein GQ464_007545 [Rhodocaloribacter litoris]